MKRGPGMSEEVPGRWEAETEARLIEFVKKVRTAESQDEAVQLVAGWLKSSHSEQMQHAGDEEAARTAGLVRAANTEEEAVNELRRTWPALVGDRLYGELGDMAEGKGVGKE